MEKARKLLQSKDGHQIFEDIREHITEPQKECSQFQSFAFLRCRSSYQAF